MAPQGALDIDEFSELVYKLRRDMVSGYRLENDALREQLAGTLTLPGLDKLRQSPWSDAEYGIRAPAGGSNPQAGWPAATWLLTRVSATSLAGARCDNYCHRTILSFPELKSM